MSPHHSLIKAEKDSLLFCAYIGPLQMIQNGLPLSRCRSLITSLTSLCHVIWHIQGSRDLDRDIYGAIMLPTAAGPSTITPPSNNTSLQRCPSKRGLLPVSMSALPLETSILYCHSPSTLDSTHVKQCIFLPSSLPPVMLVFSCLSLSVAPSPPKHASDQPAVLHTMA